MSQNTSRPSYKTLYQEQIEMNKTLLDRIVALENRQFTESKAKKTNRGTVITDNSDKNNPNIKFDTTIEFRKDSGHYYDSIVELTGKFNNVGSRVFYRLDRGKNKNNDGWTQLFFDNSRSGIVKENKQGIRYNLPHAQIIENMHNYQPNDSTARFYFNGQLLCWMIKANLSEKFVSDLLSMHIK